MARLISRKKNSENKPGEKDKGIRRILAMLIFMVLVLAVMVILPLIQNQEGKAEDYACTLAIRRAREAVIMEYLSDPELTKDQAAIVVDKSKLTFENICPSDGDYYLVNQNGAWNVTCGLHESNTYFRTRLNASRVLELLEERIATCRRLEVSLDNNIIFVINGKPLDVVKLAGDNGLRRGTDYSIDFDGIVCFFSLNAEGDVGWFVYADANHAAVWKRSDGWSGDAYSK